jgi:hypothetical protein
MRFKGPILSLLLVLMVSGLTRADYNSMRSSLRITLSRLNQLKNELKTNPLHSSIETTEIADDSSISEDLDKSQLVQEVLSQNKQEAETANSNLGVLQSLYVKSERIIIYSIGDAPAIVVNSEKEPGITQITLQGVQLDSRFKLFQNANQTGASIGLVQVNAIAPSIPEDMTTASVEIIIKTGHKNWQISPRQSGFLISKLDSPINSDISSSTGEQTPIHSGNQSSSLTKNGRTQSENLPEDRQPQVVAETLNQVTPFSTETDEIQPQINPENTTPPEINPAISEPTNTDINSVPIKEEDKTLELSSTYSLTPLQLPPTQLINLETANVLPQGSILTSYGFHVFSKKQYEAGSGQQNYDISISGGVTSQLQLGLDFSYFEDTLGHQVNGGTTVLGELDTVALGVLDFAPKFKYQFLKEKDFSIALSGSLEIGRFTGSYGLYTPTDSQQTATTLAGTLQIPFTYNISSNFQWHLVPGGIFFSNTINNGGNFYGSFFNIGTGFNYSPLDRLMLFADVNFPIGPGGNAVNNQAQIFTTPVWAAGLTFLQSPTVGIDLYATNALGSTPATQVLAYIPNGNQVAAGINISYTPDIGQNYPSGFRPGPSISLNDRDKQLLFNGITLTSANTLQEGMLSLQAGIGPYVNFQLSYGMSDNAQLEFIGQQLGNSDEPVGNSLKLGVGTKLQFLDQAHGDPFSLGIRVAGEETTSGAGSSESLVVVPSFSPDPVGIFTVELPLLYQINPQIALMFNPKGGFFGSKRFAGAGLGLNYRVFDGLQLIGEVTPILAGSGSTIWAGAIRYIHPEWNAGIDLYATNAIGTHDIGGLISQSNNGSSIGFNLLWLLKR